MKVKELKKLIQEFPDELEVVADWPEKDGAALSKVYRARVEDACIEATENTYPVLCPEFSGEHILCLKFIKKRNF